MLTVTAQLEQMVALLQLELSAVNNNAETRILDTILSDSDNILAQVVGWSKCLAPGHVTPVLTLSLTLCEVLVSCRQAGQSVLSHSRIVTPLLSLLDTVHSLGQPASPGLQSALLGLVHSLCVLLTESPSLLSLFTSDPGTSAAPRFLLFSLLTPFLHKSSPEGQLARDSLLLCISLSAQHDIVQTYIAEHSNFTTILATGLSGLYSSLPRTLDQPPTTELIFSLLTATGVNHTSDVLNAGPNSSKEKLRTIVLRALCRLNLFQGEIRPTK